MEFYWLWVRYNVTTFDDENEEDNISLILHYKLEFLCNFPERISEKNVKEMERETKD